jgi:prefoldin subunit 5
MNTVMNNTTVHIGSNYQITYLKSFKRLMLISPNGEILARKENYKPQVKELEAKIQELKKAYRAARPTL